MSERVLVVAPEGIDTAELQQNLGDIGAQVRLWSYVGHVVAVDPQSGALSDGPYAAAVVLCRRVDAARDGDDVRATFSEVHPVIDAIRKGSPSCPVTLVVDTTASVGVLEALRIDGVVHVLSWRDKALWRQTALGVAKVFGDAPWGMERLFHDADTAIISHLIQSSRQRDAMLAELATYLAPHRVNPRIVAAAQSVVDEFVINAVYNAPVDDDGRRLYASQSRTVPVELEDGDAVLLRYACDGTRLYLSIFDRFGSLEPETVRSYLVRGLSKGSDQIEYKAGGAGLGLYTVLESVTRFVVNVVPGGGTEMIGVMEALGSFRRFQSCPKSFQLFVGEAGEVAPPSVG